MAFRIHDSVVRGEIDNRVKGSVRGKIWVEGRAEPVTLELKGNAWPDLAGCLLTFTNPQKRIPHPDIWIRCIRSSAARSAISRRRGRCACSIFRCRKPT